MRANQTRLAKDGAFTEYYKRAGASPLGPPKKEKDRDAGKEVATVEAKTPKRRNTKAKEEDPCVTTTRSALPSRRRRAHSSFQHDQ